jgi:hypothetical protein
MEEVHDEWRETGMPEGLVGGILGEDDEKPEVEAAETLASADAFAAAVAAKLAGNDPGVARKTEIFLDKQAQILETQNRHLEDEHALRFAHLRNQIREERIRRFGLRLRVGFQLFVTLAATTIGIGAAILIHDAFTSRRVVIEPFHSPPGFPTRGIDGEVVASGLLDELSRLQAASRSASRGRTLEGAWAGNIKLDLPETGISIGEMSRILKDRFGHDVTECWRVEPQGAGVVSGGGEAAAGLLGRAYQCPERPHCAGRRGRRMAR